MKKVVQISLIVFTMSFLTSAVALAQKVNVLVPTDSIETGEPVTVTAAYYPEGLSFEKVKFQDTLNAKVELLEEGRLDTVIDGENLSFKQELLVTSYDTGYVIIPPIKALFSDSIYESYPALIYVSGPQVDLQKNIKDIAGISNAPWTLREWLVLIGIAVLSLGVIFLIYRYVIVYYLNKNKSIDSSKEVLVKRPFLEEFWERFDQVKSEKLWQKNQEKKYHSQVSELLKEYLEYRYPVSALEKTSSEVLSIMKVHLKEPKHLTLLDGVLNFADLVKFAKVKGDLSQHENALEMLASFVNETKLEDVGSSTVENHN